MPYGVINSKLLRISLDDRLADARAEGCIEGRGAGVYGVGYSYDRIQNSLSN